MVPTMVACRPKQVRATRPLVVADTESVVPAVTESATHAVIEVIRRLRALREGLKLISTHPHSFLHAGSGISKGGQLDGPREDPQL